MIAEVASGQAPPPDAPEKAAPDPERARHESVEESIARGLRDIRSSDVNARRRAVLLLSKYDVPQARAAVLEALRDPDPVVRRSALVAAGEWDVPPAEAARDVLRLVTDPDVQTRRLASSLIRRCLYSPLILQFLLQRTRRTPAGASTEKRPITVRAPAATAALDPEETRKIVRKALRDPDPFVRKNILSLASRFGKYFDREAIEKCLTSEDKEERVLALRACRYIAGRTGIPQIARKALKDPDPAVRVEAVRMLTMSNVPALPVLRQALNDPEPEVRAAAVRGLLMLGTPTTLAKDWPAISRFFLDDRIPASIREDALPYVGGKGPPDAVRDLLHRLTKSRSPSLRALALRLWAARLKKDDLPVDMFVGLLDDPSSDVRRAALSALSRRARDLPADVLVRMMSSRYDDVRRTALGLASLAGVDRLQAVLDEAILDDDPAIRARAVRLLGIRRVGDWKTVLTQALRDPDAEVARAAADTLLARLDLDARGILQAYLAKPDDPDLAAFIRKEIERRRRRLPYGPRRSYRAPGPARVLRNVPRAAPGESVPRNPAPTVRRGTPTRQPAPRQQK